MKNISEVVNENLCTNCGACAVVCPQNCIAIDKNEISLDEKQCINCGKCFQVCPGKKIINNKSENDLKKNVIKSFILNSKDEYKNNYVASGGFVTTFLTFLFENEYIDGVLCLFNDRHSLEVKSELIKEKGELENSSGSIYYRVPLESGLNKIQKVSSSEKYVIIGLPCQIRAVKKIEEIQENLFLTIGLFCGYMLGRDARDYLIGEALPSNLDWNSIDKISYRTIPPGLNGKNDGFLLETSNNENFFIPIYDYIFLTRFFSPKRCLMCNDMVNDQADISCGDPHGIERKSSLVLVKNELSLDFIEESIDQNYFNEVRQIDIDTAFDTQDSILEYKKGTLRARLFWMKIFNKTIPDANIKNLTKPNLSQYIGAFMLVVNSYITRTEIGKKLLHKVPNKILKIYAGIILVLMDNKLKQEDIEKFNEGK